MFDHGTLLLICMKVVRLGRPIAGSSTKLQRAKLMRVDRFILTGPPGAGKTTILRQLAAEGFATSDEAATDVIAALQQQGIDEPWTHPSFVDAIVETQRDRQINLSNFASIQFYDRSPICTLALAEWLGYPVSEALRSEIARIRGEEVYRPEVFFIRSLGFVTPTEVRRISLADSIRFGDLHERVYLAHGFKIIRIDSAPAVQRLESIKRYLEDLREPITPEARQASRCVRQPARTSDLPSVRRWVSSDDEHLDSQ